MNGYLNKKMKLSNKINNKWTYINKIFFDWQEIELDQFKERENKNLNEIKMGKMSDWKVDAALTNMCICLFLIALHIFLWRILV